MSRTIVSAVCLSVVLALACLSAGHAAAESLPTETYKGVKIQGYSHPEADNNAFFRMARNALDMADRLPEASWNKLEYIRLIQYDPPSGRAVPCRKPIET